MNVFKKKADCFAWCDQANPQHDAVWVANYMNHAYSQGRYRDGDWVRDWALKHHIDYDNAYINAGMV